MNKYRFYDTCSLILKGDAAFQEHFIISSITLEELENLKSEQPAVRQLIRTLAEHSDSYDVHIFKDAMLNPIKAEDLQINNDMKILATAINYNKLYPNQIIFTTNDLSLKLLSKIFFSENMVDSVKEEIDNYKGYIIKQDDNIEFFYSNYLNSPVYPEILVNEYLVLKDTEGNIIDRLVWTGEGYRNISFETFDSKHFGRIKPIDIQQQLVADSFTHNKITLIKGRPGSGKTLLSLGFLFNQLEKSRIDKIIVFCNTVAARNSAKLGFYPGSRTEKLLDSQIGNLLISKIGSRLEVERLIEQEELILLPMSDIRGYDTSGMNAGIYISEAQNLDITLMKLALQRIGEDSICIIDGDEKTQVDDIAFANGNNGMRRVSKVFRGHKIYGEVELDQIHRSEIGRIAEML